MLLTSEVIHKIMKGNIAFILAKLDITKAFDMIDWVFLFELLEVFSFGPYFMQFFKAITAFASSKIHLNGRSTVAIAIKRSVRQGCPISPLLFIITMEALYQMVAGVEANNQIFGFCWEALNIRYTISMYADDVKLILRANLPNITTCM